MSNYGQIQILFLDTPSIFVVFPYCVFELYEEKVENNDKLKNAAIQTVRM
jgi:hypothetical protein